MHFFYRSHVQYLYIYTYEVFLLSVFGWIVCEAIFSYYCSSETVPVYVSIVMYMSLESNKFTWHCVSI